MELWIEGTIEQVAAVTGAGLATTIATNPSIMARWTADGRSLEAVVAEACQKTSAPLYVQLHGPSFMAEMEALSEISSQIQPKLVATHAGIEAAHRLAGMGRKPLVTTVASLNQAFLAAAAGAAYIAPYMGRIEDAGRNAGQLIADIATLYDRHGIDTQIAAASIRDPDQAETALRAGAHVLVMGYDVFERLLDDDLTAAWIDGFEADWASFTFEATEA